MPSLVHPSLGSGTSYFITTGGVLSIPQISLEFRASLMHNTANGTSNSSIFILDNKEHICIEQVEN
jgi:hypothetical protein